MKIQQLSSLHMHIWGIKGSLILILDIQNQSWCVHMNILIALYKSLQTMALCRSDSFSHPSVSCSAPLCWISAVLNGSSRVWIMQYNNSLCGGRRLRRFWSILRHLVKVIGNPFEHCHFIAPVSTSGIRLRTLIQSPSKQLHWLKTRTSLYSCSH